MSTGWCLMRIREQGGELALWQACFHGSTGRQSWYIKAKECWGDKVMRSWPLIYVNCRHVWIDKPLWGSVYKEEKGNLEMRSGCLVEVKSQRRGMGALFMRFPTLCDLKINPLSHRSFTSISVLCSGHSVNLCWNPLFWRFHLALVVKNSG